MRVTKGFNRIKEKGLKFNRIRKNSQNPGAKIKRIKENDINSRIQEFAKNKRKFSKYLHEKQ